MKAIILSAGYGKRLHPLTLTCPKPLIKIGKETLLSNTIKFLKNFGVNEIVINVHYLGEQIEEYINQNKFGMSIKIIKEKDKILDTGGGVLNAINYFSNENFLIINPDTIWNINYIKKIKLLEKLLFSNKKAKCCILVVNKKKSFDQSFKGDFSLKNNLISRKNTDNLNYIYTGVQIIKSEVFSKIKNKVFSMNVVWNNLIKNYELYGIESDEDFLHVSNFKIYKKLIEKKSKL